jgi:hypothetical protein
VRSLIIAASLLVFSVAAAFAQPTACSTGQTYDTAQKKCVEKSSSGY